MATALPFDPVRLAEYTFGHSHWSMTESAFRDVFQPHSRVAVKGCHASGKTFMAADAILESLLLGGDVITTAPTDDQVRGVLWEQVNRAIQESKIPLSEWGTVNQTSIKLPTGESAIGRSTDQGVRFQGYHARPGSFLLIVVDEAPGVIAEVMQAVEGISAGGDVRLLLLGNPVIASGGFFDVFNSASSSWRRHTIDAFDTPNFTGVTLDDLLRMPEHELDANPRPYLVTRRWVRDRYLEWGTEHPLWQSRVRGQFPDQAANALFSLAWLEAAKKRPAVWSERGGNVVAGIDVAGPGKDETVVYVRQGPRVLEMHAFPDADSRGRVLRALQPWLHKGLTRVNVDSAGDGHYFTAHMRDHLPQAVEVTGINVGESATEVPRADGRTAKQEFANLKAELYWHLREQFRDGMVSGLTDQTTISQLASLLWAPNEKGLTAIERKEVAAKRGVKSPDRAEALMLAFAPTLGDQLIARAWAGLHEQTLTPQEQRLPWNMPDGGQTPESGGWLSGANWNG